METEKKFRLVAFFSSLGLGLFSPFLTLFAVSLGATSFQIGLLSALVSFTTSIFYVISLPIFDIIKDRVKLYIFFSGIGGLFFILIAHFENIEIVFLLVAFQTVFFSISAIAWNDTLVHIFPKWRRGREIGILNTFSTLGSLISYIIGGVVIRKFGFIPYLFYSSFLFTSILNNVFAMNVGALKTYNGSNSRLSEIIRDKNFIKLAVIAAIFNFSVNVGSPLFSLHLIKNLGADSLKLSIVAIISLLVSYFFSESVGKASDLLGRKTLLFFSFPFIILYPFFYSVGTTMVWIYLVTFICQIGWVAFNTSIFIYLSEISEKSDTSKYFAIYNCIVGLFSMVGSLLAGYLAEIFGIKVTLIFSTILRFFSSFLFLILEEKSGYYIKSPLSYFSIYKLINYIDGFVSVYSFVIRESKTSRIEKILKRVGDFFK